MIDVRSIQPIVRVSLSGERIAIEPEEPVEVSLGERMCWDVRFDNQYPEDEVVIDFDAREEVKGPFRFRGGQNNPMRGRYSARGGASVLIASGSANLRPEAEVETWKYAIIWLRNGVEVDELDPEVRVRR